MAESFIERLEARVCELEQENATLRVQEGLLKEARELAHRVDLAGAQFNPIAVMARAFLAKLDEDARQGP